MSRQVTNFCSRPPTRIDRGYDNNFPGIGMQKGRIERRTHQTMNSAQVVGSGIEPLKVFAGRRSHCYPDDSSLY